MWEWLLPMTLNGQLVVVNGFFKGLLGIDR